MSAQVLSLIDKDLRRFMFKKGWQELKPIQNNAVKPILERKTDVIISASTASGKTEAAFLPALTAIASSKELKGIRILYVSPLKALINDQYRRLEEMTEFLDVKVTPWHGDVSASKKNKLMDEPEGVILTTPESLEYSSTTCSGLKTPCRIFSMWSLMSSMLLWVLKEVISYSLNYTVLKT